MLFPEALPEERNIAKGLRRVHGGAGPLLGRREFFSSHELQAIRWVLDEYKMTVNISSNSE